MNSKGILAITLKFIATRRLSLAQFISLKFIYHCQGMLILNLFIIIFKN